MPFPNKDNMHLVSNILKHHTDYVINPSNAKAAFVHVRKNAKCFENRLNHVMLVLVRKLSLSTIR